MTKDSPNVDELLDKYIQFVEKSQKSEDVYNMTPEEKHAMIDRQIEALKKGRYKLLLRQDAKERVYQTKGMST